MSVTPAPSEITPQEQRAILSRAVSDHVHHGYRIETVTDQQAVLVKGRRPNHLLHLILSLLTVGVWAILVWIPLTVFGGEKRRVLTVDNYGQIATRKGHG